MRPPLRSYLRDETQAAHEQLDQLVGDLVSVAGYRGYVMGLYAHRVAVEAWLDAALWPDIYGSWRPKGLAGLIEADLADLGDATPAAAPFDMSKDIATLSGVSYVVAGSALGARLIFRKALALGFDSSRGARHLASQQDQLQDWRRLLALMECIDSEEFDRPRAAEAANAVFHQALLAMSANRVD